MVEMSSDKFVCIVDDSKLVDALGGSKGNLKSFVCDCCPRIWDPQGVFHALLCAFR